MRDIAFTLAIFTGLMIAASACDTGLAPEPPVASTGAIAGTIEYQGQWPPADSIHDLRFVALRFIPEEITDFLLNINEIEASEGLRRNVESDSFFIGDVRNGFFPFSGIAQQFGPNVFLQWRAIGLYEEGDGSFLVRGDTVRVHIKVDFDNPPDFPPTPLSP